MSARAIKCKLHDALEGTVSVENDTTIKEESRPTSDELALFKSPMYPTIYIVIGS